MATSLRTVSVAYIAAIGLIGSPTVQAQQSTGVMEVSATVTESCSVTASPMTFQLRNKPGSTATAQASVALECTGQTAYDVALDSGANALGESRRMADANSGRTLGYEIYSDSARSSRWGDRTGMDTVSGIADSDGRAEHMAYGAIAPTDGKLSAGTYTDAIVVTVNF